MDSVREVNIDGVQWLVREDLADFLLGAEALDVWKLAGRPGARCVEKEADRMAFQVSLPREDAADLALTVRIYLQPGLRDVFRRLFGRSRAFREWRARRFLGEIGIPSARAVAVGRRRSAGILREESIITETVTDVTPLDRFVSDELPRLGAAERGQCIRRAAPALADFVRRLHDNGVRHRDFGAGDVLVRTGADGKRELMLAEAAGVRIGRPLRIGARLRSLAQLNRFFSMSVSRTARLRCWKSYVRGIPFLEENRRRYARLIEEHTALLREAGWRRRERECVGTNRHFRRFRARGIRGCVARGRVEVSDGMLAGIPERGLVMPDAEVFKDSETTQVWVQTLDFGSEVRTIVIKRKRRRHGFKFLRTFLRDVGAIREWRKAHAMKVHGLPVPGLLAAFEMRRMGFLVDSYLITEKVENAGSLQTFVEEAFGGGLSEERARLRRRMARTLARIIRRVHDAGFCHRDLKPDNILVQIDDPSAGDVRFVLIDFEGVWRRRRVTEQDRARDVARIAAKFVDSPAVRTADMMHFLDEYLRGRRMSREARRAFIIDIQRRIREKIASWKAKGY